MLKYLVYVDKSLELKKKLELIDTTVETEFEGSRTYKDIEIMVSPRCFNIFTSWDKKETFHDCRFQLGNFIVMIKSLVFLTISCI